MIKEYNKNIVKCHNCSTLWTFSDEDVDMFKYHIENNTNIHFKK